LADLPSGAVTFLFTDIEESTRLVPQLRDRYGEVLAEHQRLLREAFSKHDGYEIDTQGDAFFYAFGSAYEAVQAAAAGQQALNNHVWPDETAVRVRIGIHSARATPVEGRYTGLAVHRASRICSAGHGGQVLVSQTTQSLLEDEEEEFAAGLLDLGEHRLKDIERPVRLYQVAVPGLPSQFPPPRGEALLSDALEPTLATPLWRHRGWLAAAGLVVAAVIATLFLTARGSGGGLGHIDANHLGVIDPGTNEIVDQVQVGIRPGPVAVGPRTVWVGNLDDRTLTKIDARLRTSAGTFPTPTSVGQRPTAIAAGEGAVWVANTGSDTVTRIDPGTPPTTEAIRVGHGPAAIAVGAGAIWVANAGDGTISRIDPRSYEVVKTIKTGNAPAGIAVGNGFVWVSVQAP
jgi:YVTN family beta-propeller protein